MTSNLLFFQRNNSDEYDGFFNMDTGADDIDKVRGFSISLK